MLAHGFDSHAGAIFKNKTMRKITQQAVDAFNGNKPFKSGNTEIEVATRATIMRLFGNEIAFKYHEDNSLWITNCGWDSATTKGRLNALDGVSIQQAKGKWYLNGELWNGKIIQIK